MWNEVTFRRQDYRVQGWERGRSGRGVLEVRDMGSSWTILRHVTRVSSSSYVLYCISCYVLCMMDVYSAIDFSAQKLAKNLSIIHVLLSAYMKCPILCAHWKTLYLLVSLMLVLVLVMALRVSCTIPIQLLINVATSQNRSPSFRICSRSIVKP